jgi:hypothetical protein
VKRDLLLIDTNLLLLLVVGLTNENYIAKHKRLQGYEIADFHHLRDVVSQASTLLFVPNVLTEASSFLRMIDDPIKTELMHSFAGMIARVEESYVASADVTERVEFARLGLTDAVLLQLAESGGTLLTVDLDLYLAANSSGLAVINFTPYLAAASG